MDISKARKFVELTKDNRKILVTLYEGGQISSCIEEEARKYCETCQGDDELCQDYVEHLKSRGYEATEIEVGELELEESLPRFLEEREITVEPKVAVAVQPEGDEHALSGTAEDIPGSSETLPEGG